MRRCLSSVAPNPRVLKSFGAMVDPLLGSGRLANNGGWRQPRGDRGRSGPACALSCKERRFHRGGSAARRRWLRLLPPTRRAQDGGAVPQPHPRSPPPPPDPMPVYPSGPVSEQARSSCTSRSVRNATATSALARCLLECRDPRAAAGSDRSRRPAYPVGVLTNARTGCDVRRGPGHGESPLSRLWVVCRIAAI